MARTQPGTLSKTDTSTTERSEDGALRRPPVAAIAVLLEADRPRAGALVAPLDGVKRVVVQRGQDRKIDRRGDELVVTLPDRRVSKPHAAIVRKTGGAFVIEDLGSSNGTTLDAFDGGERVTSPRMLGDRLLHVGHCVLAILPDAAAVLERARARRPWPFLTLSPAFAGELARLERVAASALPLLLLGETGTGKEVIARAVHEASERPGAFVAVNCAAIPPNLVEAQLFGHKAGAFSGATRDEIGFVRAADRGTLFLDEIGDLGAPAQAALLRVLQEGEVTPVGAFQPVKVSVRVLSATHRPLPELVAAGRFRADLFARLQGFTFRLPPLRERLVDLGELLAKIWPESPTAPTLHTGAADALFAYDYPMNVRELKQAIDAAAVLADGAVKLADLPEPFARGLEERSPRDDADGALREELSARLAASGNNVSQVAREMGKARQQIQRWIKRFGLKTP